ncbi:hypothetical protein ACFSDD_17645 [Salipiger marinus]|uniref:hypothetical protein n=1 Tax=Salipiger marinus TaxID=555512 RepID=UPI002BC58E4C|nr:hypothetical protein [Salipiger manganoxidans]MEB3421764.1 hypothetical protein [Salipiger manganoxidans]
MDNDDVRKLQHQIKRMLEDTAEFASEFSELSDDELETLADAQAEIAAVAEYKKHAAETEIRIRALRSSLTKST